MTTQRKYIGARYVPLVMGEWDITATYEPLSIVLYEGKSYTSRTFVPANIQITDDAYWALSCDYSAGDEGYAKAYETVTDMQADTTLAAGMICHTLGFHAAGDGGAAWYVVESSGTANGMDVLALDSGVAVLQITEPYVTPEMFGAYGDGIYDDVQNIQRAIDYLPGGTVQCMAAKTYLCSEPIVLHRGICLKGSAPYDGAARGSVIKLADNSNCPLIQTPNAAGTGVATHFMMLENMTLDGNMANQTVESNLVEFYGAFIGSIIRNVHISNFYGTGLMIQEADIQLDNIWIISGCSETGRYAFDTNPDLGESSRACMVNANNFYIEQYRNNKNGSSIDTPADREHAIRIRKCCTFNANEIHFEGCLTPITIESSWNVLLNNASVGVAGYSSADNKSIVYCKSLPRLLYVSGLIITSQCYFDYWIMKNPDESVTTVKNVPITSGFYCLPLYVIEDSASAVRPIIQQPTFSNNIVIDSYGSSGKAELYTRASDDKYSIFRQNGNYYTEIVSKCNQSAEKVFLQINSTGGQGDLVSVFDPFRLGTRTTAAGVLEGSIYRYDNGSYKRPVYQKTTGVQDAMNTVATMRLSTLPPSSSASYIGEMYLDYQQKHLYIATSVGNGASDWLILN